MKTFLVIGILSVWLAFQNIWLAAAIWWLFAVSGVMELYIRHLRRKVGRER